MSEDNISDFTKARLAKNPISYEIIIIHDSEGKRMFVKDLARDPRTLRALADDLDWAAGMARAEAEEREKEG